MLLYVQPIFVHFYLPCYFLIPVPSSFHALVTLLLFFSHSLFPPRFVQNHDVGKPLQDASSSPGEKSEGTLVVHLA